MSIKTFLVDDSPEILHVLRLQYSLRPEIHIVGQASSLKDALVGMAELDVDMVSLDIQLGPESGLDLCTLIRKEYPGVFVVICSVDADEEMRKRATQAGADVFIAKPVSSDDLQVLIQQYRARTKHPQNIDPVLTDWMNDLLS